jgi:ribosomal subunit interface protein
MKIQITARHYHTTQNLHQNLTESAERLARFNDSVEGVHFILDAGQPGVSRAEGIVKIHDKSVVAHAEEGAMGKAIEMMLEKIERQIKKENEKLKIHKAGPLSAAMAGAQVAA